MAMIMALLMLAVYYYLGLGLEVGINDNMIAVNSIPILDNIILIVFVSMMILVGIKAMSSEA